MSRFNEILEGCYMLLEVISIYLWFILALIALFLGKFNFFIGFMILFYLVRIFIAVHEFYMAWKQVKINEKS
ncbi:MAG: hypothetical protein VX154_06225 [Pseudomonadota bacterium]|nr:hypothetical protein [Pseudomonadota bacterium]